jgi:hypothetical protein
LLLALFLLVGGGGLVWAATHEPTYPTVTTNRGNVFTLSFSGQMLSPAGRWAEFDYLSPDGSGLQDDSAAEELLDVVGPVAAQHGDSILYVVAVHRKIHLGYLWSAQLRHAMRFELNHGEWLRVNALPPTH